MLWKEWVSIHKVALQLRVFYIKNICIEFFEISIGQLIDVDGKPVSKNYLKLLSPYVDTAIEDLTFISADLSRFSTILVSVLSEYFRNIISILFLVTSSVGVLVWIMI